MVYITGDTHGDFRNVERFCAQAETTKEDILIILGDAGINYYGNPKDMRLKERLSQLPVTLFSIHGNHEKRPEDIASYMETEFHGGIVFVEQDYPNLLFAKDGELFEFDSKRCFVIGGAYSVDKFYRLLKHYGWWPDEQPSDETKRRVEERLSAEGWRVDIVLSHTCPMKYIPTEMFLSVIDQRTVDNSTEEWLDTIEERLDYGRWYCGHYHGSKVIDRLRFMFEDFMELK